MLTLIGWDPIFEYEGKTYVSPFLPLPITNVNSYAEMDKTEKNKISHRFRALEKLKTWLQAEV